MNIKEVRKTVGKLKARLFKKANSHTIGMLKTQFKGTGLQFKEHQVYNFGDDVRFIDWKLLAKTNNPYVKTFNEERNVEIVVVIDLSPSMLMGHQGKSKLEVAIELACLLYLTAHESHDYVHIILMGKDLVHIPKKSGEEGISLLISQLEKLNVLNQFGKINYTYFENIKNDKDKNYKALLKHLHYKREVVIFSDFMDLVDLESLKKMSLRSHVNCVQLIAPFDEADAQPFSFLSRSELGSFFGQYQFESQSLVEKSLGKKIKKIRIKEKYLDQFIKNMV